MEIPKFNLRVDTISAPGGYQYIVVDEEDEERGVLYGPTESTSRASAFIQGYCDAVEWVEEIEEEDTNTPTIDSNRLKEYLKN